MKKLEAVLDFGSSKVVCLIGNCDNGGQFEVYGFGVCEYKGIRKGRFVDETDTRRAIRLALEGAQNEAHRSVRTVIVGVPGAFTKVVCRKGSLIYEVPSQITERDVRRFIASSLLDEPPDLGCSHLHSVPVSFKIDGNPVQDDVVGIVAQELSGIVSHVYMRDEFESIIQGILEEMGLKVVQYVSSLFAETQLLIPEKAKKNDSIVVDIGYYSTDVCILRNQAIIYHQVLPVGGMHLSKDISYVLGISESTAEDIKRRHVFGLDYTARKDVYKLTDGRTEEFSYDIIQDVLEARTYEISDMILEALDESPIPLNKTVPMYVSGGGLILMRGSRELLQRSLDMNVIQELPLMPRKSSPCYVTSYGVLKYCCRNSSSESSAGWKENRVVQAILDFFTQ